MNLNTFLMRYKMNPKDYRDLVELISLYGSAKFWAGANNNESYDKFIKHAESYYKEILVFLNRL